MIKTFFHYRTIGSLCRLFFPENIGRLFTLYYVFENRRRDDKKIQVVRRDRCAVYQLWSKQPAQEQGHPIDYPIHPRKGGKYAARVAHIASLFEPDETCIFSL